MTEPSLGSGGSHLLLLIPSYSYKAADFLKAARRLKVNLIVAGNRQQTLEAAVPGKLLTLNFHNINQSTERVVAVAKEFPIVAVVSTDDEGSLLAAAISKILSLPYNSISSITASWDKAHLREKLRAANVASPSFQCFSIMCEPENISGQIQYPVVLKPTFLSGSQGVIRANNIDEFSKAFHRIKRIFKDPEVILKAGERPKEILVEAYIPGKEVAFEGLLQGGELTRIALFDKPDPLEGPYFEETIYTTPSRLPASVQEKIEHCVKKGVAALGLKEGPIHAELRLSNRGPVIIEIAPRSIGGRCSRILQFKVGFSLEEIILRQALGLSIESLARPQEAAGVMMIPIPKRGLFNDVDGIEEAKKVNGITGIDIMAYKKQEIVPLPEGRSYFGFIFAKGGSPEAVEVSLRKAHQKLIIKITSS